jgi:drug/metabolite transporter (DMT)-like permease
MKLNFWQWLGVILLVLGAALWVYEHNKPAIPAATTTQRSR